MKTILLCALITTSAPEPLLIDFGTNGNRTDWFVLNDGVMGGRSGGQAEYTENSLVFKGTVSLENNGGFASIRSPFTTYNLAPYKSVEIKYKLTGMTFALTMANSRRWYNPNYKANLKDTQGKWETITLPLLAFKQYQVGKPTGYTITQETLSKVIRLGFISNEKRAGEFTLEIDYINFL